MPMTLRHATAPGTSPAVHPPLGYAAVDDPFRLPEGMTFASVSGIAFNSRGHIFVLHRGPQPLMEFDADGTFIRAFGAGLFDRPHGLRIDRDDNIWTTDVAAHVVLKLSPSGKVLLVLGVKGRPGEWHEYGHLRLFEEPNDLAFGLAGEIYVAQGHGKGEPRIVKFDRDGNFVATWGRKGKTPGEFDIAHSIVIDDEGLLHVADRNNERIQVFDGDGRYIRASQHPGTPCGLCIDADRHLWLAHGHTGKVMKLDLAGTVLGATGGQGKALGQFGEAHYIAVSPQNDVYVTDTLNWRIQKFVRTPV
jgi:sugar lactone lactonase YvrE